MAIVLYIPPEQKQSVRQQAERPGQNVTTYLLNCAGMRITHPPPLSDEEWERLLEEVSSIVPADVPPLSDYAVSREGIYEERVAQILGDDYER